MALGVLSMERALILARGKCETDDCSYCETDDCSYGTYCPRYWRRVFILYFEDEPANDEDPRWDELFKFGFPTRQRLVEEEKSGKRKIEPGAVS